MTGDEKPAPRVGVRRGIYALPALFTLANILCGYLSIDSAVAGNYYQATLLLFVAGILDGIDGRVARLTRTTSAFGEQLDSLADVISFGVAPAFLAYHWGLHPFGRFGLLVSFLFIVCGACRLARFNVQIHVVDKRFFVGLPIPSAAGALCGIIWVHPAKLNDPLFQGLFLAATICLSYLMISTLRYRSFKDFDRGKLPAIVVPAIALVIVAIVWMPERTLAALAALYALSGPAARLFGLFTAPRRGPRSS